MCTCGTPSKANFYVRVIIESVIEDTTYADWYLCEEHVPCEDSVADWYGQLPGTKGWRVVELDEYAHIR